MKKKRQLTDRMNGPDQEFFVWKDMKVLRRRCVIREYDFKKVRGEALSTCYGYALYDRAEFIPLSKDNMQQEYLMSVLKGKEFTGLAGKKAYNAGLLAELITGLCITAKFFNLGADITV